MTTYEVLVKARDIVKDFWTSGELRSSSAGGYYYCAVGAIVHAVAPDNEDYLFTSGSYKELVEDKQIYDAINSVASHYSNTDLDNYSDLRDKEVPVNILWRINDRKGRAAVLEYFDKAIEAEAEKELQSLVEVETQEAVDLDESSLVVS